MNATQAPRGSQDIFISAQVDNDLEEEGAKIYLVSDISHLIKKWCNHLENSDVRRAAVPCPRAPPPRPRHKRPPLVTRHASVSVQREWGTSKKGSRYMCIPEHLVRSILDRFPAPGHAAPIRGECDGLECYMRVAGRLWELLGSGSAPVYTTANPKKDVRIQELLDIKAWVSYWHEFNVDAACNATASAAEKKAMGFSHQLLFDTNLCITGFIDVVADLERRHGTGDFKAKTGCRLIARKLCQDALESLFGRLRQALGGKREVSVLDASTRIERLEKKATSKARRQKESKKRLKRQNASANSDSEDDSAAAPVAAAPAAAALTPKAPGWLDEHRILLDHTAVKIRHAAAMAAPKFQVATPVW